MVLEPLQLLVLSVIGVFVGWLNVMAGGGSLLSVPALLFMGLPAPVANGTNRIAILLQNFSAVVTFFRQGLSDFALSIRLALIASVGALAGAFVGVELEGVWFDRLLALVMLCVLLLMLFQRPATENSFSELEADSESGKMRYWLAHLCMLAVGFWGGIIQIGVGFILMPVLQRMLGLDLIQVNMHKVFITMVYTIVALAVFASQVDIAWDAGFALAAGTIIGGWLGAHTSLRKGQAWIRRVLIITLIAFIGKLLLL